MSSQRDSLHTKNYRTLSHHPYIQIFLIRAEELYRLRFRQKRDVCYKTYDEINRIVIKERPIIEDKIVNRIS